MAWFDRWVTLWETQRRSKPTCSFLGLGHQLVVFLKGQLHGFPLGSHLKRQIFLYRFITVEECLPPSSVVSNNASKLTSHVGSTMALHQFKASAVQGRMVSVLPW